MNITSKTNTIFMLHSVYSCELRVTFFNELAEQLEKQLKHTAEEQVTIIIASAKVNQHEGKNSVRWHVLHNTNHF